ncbi:hypothetical protein QTP88_015400 [Uroleucon formosanum]
METAAAAAPPSCIRKMHCSTQRTEVSIFVFEKKLADKLHKPRRKETVTEILKKSVHYLEMLRQPKLILKVVHSVEDCNDTLAFAAEPVIASLANILAYQASVGGRAVNGPPSTGASIITATAMPRPAHAREYNFLDFEIKYGIRQLENQIHNVLPKLPAQLQEMATKMLSKDVDARPFVKNLLHTPYFW